jgi:hypothetical protein
MRVLLDASLEPVTLLEIRRSIKADPAVREVKWITGRNAGRFRFVEAGVALRVPELDRAEAAMRRIEAAVRAAVPHVERALLHAEAADSPLVRWAVPLADTAGTVSRHFGEAPFFALATLRRGDGAIEEQRVVANPHRALETAKGIRVAEWLVGQKIDVVALSEDVQKGGGGT